MAETTLECPFGTDDDCNITLTLEYDTDTDWYIVDGEHDHTRDMTARQRKTIDDILIDRSIAAYEDDVDRRIDEARERALDKDWRERYD